jgi:rhodanese-related sulfurtransferase
MERAVLALETKNRSVKVRHMRTSCAVLLGLIVTCFSALAEKSVLMTPEDAAKWLGKTPGVQMLDVRTKEEYKSGHLQNAVLIPWTDRDFEERAAAELRKDQPLFVYCRSGGRSGKATMALVKLGFTRIHELQGGILAWEKAGKKTTPAN